MILTPYLLASLLAGGSLPGPGALPPVGPEAKVLGYCPTPQEGPVASNMLFLATAMIGTGLVLHRQRNR